MPAHHAKFTHTFLLAALFLASLRALQSADTPPAARSTSTLDFSLPSPLLYTLDSDAKPQSQRSPLGDSTEERVRLERLEKYFRPPDTAIAALSPDGKYLAYSARHAASLQVFVANADAPEKILTVRIVLTDDDAGDASGYTRSDLKAPARITWMAWLPPDRLVVEYNRAIAQMSGFGGIATHVGAVSAMNADGSNARLLATPFDVSPRTFTGIDLRVLKNEPAAQAGLPAPENTDLFSTTPYPGRTNMPASERAERMPAAHAHYDAPPLTRVPNDFRSIWNAVGRPQPFHVLGICPDDPQSILLRTDRTPCGIFKANVFTGKLRELSQTSLSPASLLISRQGKPALRAVPGARGASSRYLHNTGKGWRELTILQRPAGSPERIIPIGFDTDPDILYYASNTGRSTYGIYSINLATGQPAGTLLESDTCDLVRPVRNFIPNNILVFDRHTQKLAGIRIDSAQAQRTTHWLNPDQQIVQRSIEHALPANNIQILDWNSEGTRYLIHATSPYEPGVFYLYERPAKKLFEFARSMPWLDKTTLGPQSEFGFTTDSGAQITGVLTMPAQPRTKTIPVIVFCNPLTLERRHVFRPEIFAFASMGYAVVEMDGSAAGALAMSSASDRINTVLDNLAKQQLSLNFKQIVLIGESRTATAALELLRLNPERFSCAVAISPSITNNQYLTFTTGRFSFDKNKKTPPRLIEKPIYILATRKADYMSAEEVFNHVHNRGIDCAFDDLPTEYLEEHPLAKAEVYSRIETFINAVTSNAKVRLGPMRVIDGKQRTPSIPIR